MRSPTLGEASFEYKLDGARIQVHKVDDEVRVYSRTLRDVTIAVPEVVTVARAMPAREIVLDGEAIALRPDGTPHPFQDTMRRFGRKLDVERPAGTSCRSRRCSSTRSISTAIRWSTSRSPGASALLGEQVAPANLVPRLVTSDADAAAAFAARALATGHEGVMAKAVDGLYAAGRRGQAWLKVKQARTLDLVVLAAEWGSGRRRGTLSNLHLGARDSERGGFVMLGKTFKGLTDEMLAWQTKKFLELEIGRDDYTVYVRPEVVVEIAFNDVQASPQYPGGVALRFARVKRYRTDKTAAEADTFATIQAIYRSDPRLSRCRSSGAGSVSEPVPESVPDVPESVPDCRPVAVSSRSVDAGDSMRRVRQAHPLDRPDPGDRDGRRHHRRLVDLRAAVRGQPRGADLRRHAAGLDRRRRADLVRREHLRRARRPRIPRTGGVYVFLREMFSPAAGFLWGWAMFWSMHSGIIAAIAMVFGRYTATIVPLDDLGIRLVAVARHRRAVGRSTTSASGPAARCRPR